MIRWLAVLVMLGTMPAEGQDTVVLRGGHAACRSRADVLMLDQIAAADAESATERWYSVARQMVLEGRCILTDSTWAAVVSARDDTTGLWGLVLTDERKGDTTYWVGREAVVEPR